MNVKTHGLAYAGTCVFRHRFFATGAFRHRNFRHQACFSTGPGPTLLGFRAWGLGFRVWPLRGEVARWCVAALHKWNGQPSHPGRALALLVFPPLPTQAILF